tara:strand:+ start:814 stop:1119 length:306 start_codon:yes stop_codon:yes gene_type:complete
MTLLNDLNNMVDEIKNKTRTTEFKDKIKKKYNKIFDLSEKLFDKIYEKDLTTDEINIVSTMIRMKLQRDNGDIEKLQADKNIGELLCKTYVEPMLKKKKSN